MNFDECITSNVNFESLGGYHYTVIKDNENVDRNSCNINLIDIKQVVGDDTRSHSLSNDMNTKFYIVSLSVIAVFIFSRILIKSKNQ